MKQLDCDILVIGAGPAGSAAALAAASEGVRVRILERRAQVGVPVRCAEYIPALLRAQIDIDGSIIAQAVKGMMTNLPSGEIRKTNAPGYLIYRERFDQALSEAAVSAGAQLHLKTDVTDFVDGAAVARVDSKQTIKIKPDIIIGADGPHSRVARWIGSVNHHMLPAVQLKMKLTQPLDHTEVYFDKDIYAGYAWLFPKKNEANIGLGMQRRNKDDGQLARLLHSFAERLAVAGKVIGEPYAYTGGWIPVGAPRCVHKDNVILAGDAAGHTHPITGAGIFNAIMGGRIAGKCAARAILAGRPTLLAEYESKWRALLQDTLTRAFCRRQFMEQSWDRMDEIIKSCWVAFRQYYDDT